MPFVTTESNRGSLVLFFFNLECVSNETEDAKKLQSGFTWYLNSFG